MRGGRRLSMDDAVALVRPRDTLACGLAVGQPQGFLEALGRRGDLEEVELYTGLLAQPYSFLQSQGVRVVSGFFGPVERAARALGARVEYLAADFHGLERLALGVAPRLVLAATTPPDAEGWLSLGLHAGATFRPLQDAARDPARVALAEVNPRMPRLLGLPELGGHRIHLSELDGWVEHEGELLALPEVDPTPEEVAIARHVAEQIGEGATLQFGIGGVPDTIARLLAAGAPGGFGVHTELMSDGVMHLHEAGKVTNRKGLYDGVSDATFALGSERLYRWLDGNPAVRMLPVSAVNDPALLRRLGGFVSVNGALAVDLLGQVAADHVGGRQYSGVGGHESFVMGAREAPGGRSFVCLRATAQVDGVRVSTIVPRLPEGASVTTPRHHAQFVVTEHGAVDVSILPDQARARALVELAHPDFRPGLAAALPR